jgi:hypothetical protein
MVGKPDLGVLGRIRWQWFVTLTFKREVTHGRQDSMVFAFLREAARKFGVHFHRLLWVRRRERGETFGREHLHLLIGGVSPMKVTRWSCFALKDLWEGLGGGIARVTLFDARLNAGDYLTKPGRFVDVGGQVYEVSKFDDRTAELMFAHSVTRGLRRHPRWVRAPH